MFFFKKKVKVEVSRQERIQSEIFHQLRRCGPLDSSQIYIELAWDKRHSLVVTEEELTEAIRVLLDRRVIEVRPEQKVSDDPEDTVYGLPTWRWKKA